MADTDDEDAALTSRVHVHEDNDGDGDEFQDFRFLAALSSKSGAQLPKRGEKDFEPHGTKHQSSILDASRQAMHDALSFTRVHASKGYNRAFYYGPEHEKELQRDEFIKEEWRQGIDDDHVVLVDKSGSGPHFKGIGKPSTGKRWAGLWLLPEEALYLVERGNLDLWWSGRRSWTNAKMESEEDDTQGEHKEGYLEGEVLRPNEELDEGFPMSLQAAYSVLIGKEGEKGKVTLEKYTVFTNLKRMGYVVFRAPLDDQLQSSGSSNKPTPTNGSSNGSWYIFSLLFGSIFREPEIQHAAYGPLVKPGMYRSYNSIYRQIAIIPRHQPNPDPLALTTSTPSMSPLPLPTASLATPVPTSTESASDPNPYRVVFHLWKPSRLPTFAKTNPGLPDFHVAITDARSSYVPSLTQITSLLDSTPWAPPIGKNFEGPGKMYQRLKHGWRNVVLAVIDQGVISYLRLGEVAFGEEKLFERFDVAGGAKSGPKRGGGGAGRGRGRGRGRGC